MRGLLAYAVTQVMGRTNRQTGGQTGRRIGTRTGRKMMLIIGDENN